MKIFVTGGTGLVGSNVIHVAREKYDAEVVASMHERLPAAPVDYAVERVDITDGRAFRETLLRHRPEAVVHCAATVDIGMLERDHALGWRLMVEATRGIARSCGEIGAHLVLVSSDWVFGGGTPPYAEDTPPCPVNYYGLLKVVGEAVAGSVGISCGIARIAAVYGRNWSFPEWVPRERVTGFGTLANWMLDRLRRGEEIVEPTQNVNLEANPTLASDCADAMLVIARRRLSGTFHCCGRRSVERVELGRLVARTFGLDPDQVRAATGSEEIAAEGPPVPLRTCLDTSTTERILERRNLPPEEGLREWKAQLAREPAMYGIRSA